MTLAGTLVFSLSALLINAAAGYAALRRNSVSGSGAVAGALVGSVILIAGGFLYWIMLMLFFASSSAASRVGRREKRRLEQMHERGSRRDHVQVAANAGIAALAVLLLRITGNAGFGVAAAAAFASANADTWSSELGVLSRRPPRSIITWRRLETGTSGGVSLAGTLAGLAGSLLIAGWYAVAHLVPGLLSTLVATASSLGAGASAGTLLLAVTLGGVAGTTTDSILGATVQVQYRTRDGELTERPSTRGHRNERVRGARLVTNDVVNFLSSAAAAAVGWLVVAL